MATKQSLTTPLRVVSAVASSNKRKQKAADMYDGYFEFDTHDVPCWFNHEKEKAEKEIMLDLIAQIVARLTEINDGSFVIEDLETARLKAL